MDLLLFGVSLTCLFVAALHYLLFLAFQNEVLAKVARWGLWGALGGQALFFIARVLQGNPLLASGLYEGLVFFSSCLLLAFLLLTLRFRVPVLGAFVVPLAFILQALAAFNVEAVTGHLPPQLRSFWYPFHVGFAFLGEALFAVACATGVMYLLQEKGLKRKRPGAFYHRLPSLDVLDLVNHRSLTLGFLFLTVGIVTGAFWAQNAWQKALWNPKVIWSLGTWLIYAAVLHARLTAGWRGRRAAILSILGFAAVLFTFLGVDLLLGGEHSFLAK